MSEPYQCFSVPLPWGCCRISACILFWCHHAVNWAMSTLPITCRINSRKRYGSHAHKHTHTHTHTKSIRTKSMPCRQREPPPSFQRGASDHENKGCHTSAEQSTNNHLRKHLTVFHKHNHNLNIRCNTEWSVLSIHEFKCVTHQGVAGLCTINTQYVHFILDTASIFWSNTENIQCKCKNK